MTGAELGCDARITSSLDGGAFVSLCPVDAGQRIESEMRGVAISLPALRVLMRQLVAAWASGLTTSELSRAHTDATTEILPLLRARNFTQSDARE